MLNINIGCAGWLYEDWKGAFYPRRLDAQKYLTFYSRFFNIVEINTTFYSLPTKQTVINWNIKVPSDFRFIVKVWQNISHKLNNSDVDVLINQFFEQLEPLKNKIYAYLFQFPPWLQYSPKHLDQIRFIINQSPPNYKYVIELRHNSWFKEEILSQIADGTRIFIGTSYLDGVIPYYKLNQEMYYIRLIGDRELSRFDRIQRENKNEINDMLQTIENLKKNPKIFEIFIIVNNHYTGFAPETVNLLKRELNLAFKNFNQQKKLSDYL